MFHFVPLLGAQSNSPASQSLLEFDGGVKVLIDVGWDNDFDVAKLKDLERYAVYWRAVASGGLGACLYLQSQSTREEIKTITLANISREMALLFPFHD